MTAAAQLLDAIVPIVRARLPRGVDGDDLDDFLDRYRPTLLVLLEQNLGPVLRRIDAANNADFVSEDIPEHWTVAKRTAANIAAMTVAATVFAQRRLPTREERAVVAGYSGWGGLSIQAAAGKFPQGFPAPEERGLIHEFYTPSRVAREVARLVAPLVPGLPSDDGLVHALEPSAGIGRFLAAFERVPGLEWHAAEWSELSSKMLKAMFPELDLFAGPFERWVREKGPAAAGRFGLVVSNPPYGARGASISDDPDRSYREKLAYHYFLRRGLDLLAPGGLGVYLVPGGFLTSRTPQFIELRTKVLKRHHLAAAYRLPSINEKRREAIFPGAMLVTDLLFFRARGGELDAVDRDDERILDGRYFEQFPRHILGREVGRDAGDDDQTRTPRWGYQVQGEFTRLPDLVERPICGECKVVAFPVARALPDVPGAGRVGVTRTTETDVTHLSRELASAVLLGLRADKYLALVAAENAEEPPLLWRELLDGLEAWRTSNGNPHGQIELMKLAKGGNTGAERFLSAFDRAGYVIEGLRRKPPVFEPRYTGRADDAVAQAEHLYRSARALTRRELLEYHASLGAALTPDAVMARVLDAGWCLDGDDHAQLVPGDVYLTGALWPKLDRLMTRDDAQSVKQRQRLLDAIKPAIFDDIEGVSARQGWLPLDLVAQWVNATYTGYDDVTFVRQGGLVAPKGWQYDQISKKEVAGEMHPEVLLLIGWMNHDKTLFSPSKKFDDDNEKDIDKIRMKKAAEWDASFKGWAGATPERRIAIEHAYNRQFRGFVAPTFTAEPLPIARWRKDGPRLHPHQVAGARRILANRGGLLAFDVGVGKTYTALALLARARQEGWCRRPVVLVPNSIVWKWHADIARVLPDYRVAVIGSKQKTISRGERKGLATSDTDTPQERAEKWTRFQAGEYDVVLLTYTALGRTRMNEKAVRAYAEQCEAIQREVALRRRNAAKRKKLSERDEAILREGVAAWVAQQMELAEGWEYDPGIAWDDIGVDLLICDEAQNYKNLYLPEDREGGVPRFMGNPGDGSKRAWQLDFRCAAVRKRTGGTGVVLLSATPAKNSPLEFYNLIQYVDPDAWRRMGIRDPEQFIDRYLRIEIKPVVTPSMEVEERGAVVGFQNLHELRDTILRYGEFRTAEEVGLKLPDPKVEMVEVDMDPAQDAKYDRYVREIEAALKSDDPSDKAKILGLLARMALVAIHSQLDQGYGWKNADQVSDPNSPKFEALAERVLANRTCGHIVFVDNVAAHRWVKMTLVNAGIAADRIGVLNAEVAPNAADRQRIAKEFNGDADEGAAPKFDVVIANQIAYEGIDLQTRTCAIHHLDLPWEPATLQQRNGRGVRQGNTLSAIAIYYYFARRSQDGLRFNLIQGKRGWMTQLLKSQDRDTNNPGAQMDMGPEEILLLISRNPEQTRARLEAVRAQREAEAKKKIAAEASKLLRAINARFRNAQRTRDGVEAARLRGEAEERLKHLARVNVEAWPWAEHAIVVRDRPVLVAEGGGLVYEGLRVGIPSAWNASRIDYIEFGKVTKDGQIALRAAGEASWKLAKADDAKFTSLKPENYGATFPADEEPATLRAVAAVANDRLRYSGDWPGLGWHHGLDAWIERTWPQVADTVIGGARQGVLLQRPEPEDPRCGAFRAPRGERRCRGRNRGCHRAPAHRGRVAGVPRAGPGLRTQVRRARRGRALVVGADHPPEPALGRGRRGSRRPRCGGRMSRADHTPLLLGAGAFGLLVLAVAASPSARRTASILEKKMENLITDWMPTLLRKTSQHEGYFWSVQENLDGNGVSYGILQWTQKSGSLGRLLRAMAAAAPADFARVFGPSWRKVLDVTARASMEPVDGVPLWTGDWVGRFEKAGRLPVFQQVQSRVAVESEYMTGAVEIARTLGVSTERAMTLYYNRTVHQGSAGALGPAKRLAAWYAQEATRRPAAPNDVVAQYAWTCAAKFRRTSAPERRNYNDDGNIWWSPVPSEWSELGVGRYRVQRVGVSGVWHAVTGPPSKPWSLYDLITKRSSDILTDPTLRDLPVALPGTLAA